MKARIQCPSSREPSISLHQTTRHHALEKVQQSQRHPSQSNPDQRMATRMVKAAWCLRYQICGGRRHQASSHRANSRLGRSHHRSNSQTLPGVLMMANKVPVTPAGLVPQRSVAPQHSPPMPISARHLNALVTLVRQVELVLECLVARLSPMIAHRPMNQNSPTNPQSPIRLANPGTLSSPVMITIAMPRTGHLIASRGPIPRMMSVPHPNLRRHRTRKR